MRFGWALSRRSWLCPPHVWALLERLSLEDRKVFESRIEKIKFKPDKKAIATELKDACDGGI